MDFTKIIVVSGKSGAFKVIAQSRSGYIVESLIDGKKMPVSAANRVSSVEDIVVFTETDEVKLKDVFKKMKEYTGGNEAVDHKSDDQQIRDFFQQILPNYDRERVYLSDMKKMVFWYNLLHKNSLLDFEEEEKEKAKEQEKEDVESSMHEKKQADKMDNPSKD